MHKEEYYLKKYKKRYYLPNVEIKNHNVMIAVKNFLDQPVKANKATYENI